MSKLLLVGVIVMAFAVPALGQGGSIGIFSDPVGTNCNLSDVAPGLAEFYFVHVGTGGAQAAQFYAPQPACYATATYLTTICLSLIGPCNAQTGITTGYGGCFAGPIHVATVSYFGTGLTDPCCYYPVLPDPIVPSGQIEVVDCGSNIVFATGGEGTINSDPSCNCSVAAETSTWGKVKAAYIE
jgi:hypothetical protein